MRFRIVSVACTVITKRLRLFLMQSLRSDSAVDKLMVFICKAFINSCTLLKAAAASSKSCAG